LRTVLRKIRETKRDKVAEDWRKLHIEEPFDFCHHQAILGWYMKGDQIRGEMWHLTTGNRNAYRSSVGKPEVKIKLESPKRRWGDNIEMDLKEEK